MLKIQEIETKLAAINQASFQNLCDEYIFFTEPDYPDIHRSGSQKGKQKTRKGKPDSYYMTRNGKYVLIEYTTQSKVGNPKSFFAKVKKDLNDCLDLKITRIPKADIEKLIYCCNSSLDIKEHRDLTNHYLQKGVKLELKTLDSLSIGLSGRCGNLAREYLGISIDTGQILPIQTFIDEYESSGFATTLKTIFISRENELSILEKSVQEGRISIISGPPGVGKTRLILALLEKITRVSSNNIQCYCLTNKHAPIYEDLRTYLPDGKDFLVLIDDANRQSGNLDSILPFLSEKRNNPIKLLITVRDYALENIEALCQSYNPETIKLSKLTDEEITDILKSESFGIVNPEFINRILFIADGNPRKAVMAAKVALKENTLSTLADVSDLYDKYFGNAINKKVFDDPKLLKALGIISFFQHINWLDTEFCLKLFRLFDFESASLKQACQDLEKMELLESNEDYSIVKIPEQTLGTYFFYRSFFKDPVLDFYVILSNYFDSHLWRITDTVIPANNTFGYENVNRKIDPYISQFWQSISNNEEKAFQFMSIFWLYKMDEALAFADNKITSLPKLRNPEFKFDERKAQSLNNFNADKYLSLLSNFFSHSLKSLEDAINLSISYTLKVPHTYSQLIKSLRDQFILRPQDENEGFYRQVTLITYLTQNTQNAKLASFCFFDIMPTLIKTKFNSSSLSRNRNSFTLYTYKLPLTNEIEILRKLTWDFINLQFKKYPGIVINFILNYLENNSDKEKAILEYDLSFLTEIYAKHFSIKSFIHCFLVHDTFYVCKRQGVKSSTLEELKTKFTNPAYIMYNKLTNQRLRGKEDHEYSDPEKYLKVREQETRNLYVFKTIKDFKEFFQVFKSICAGREKEQASFNHSLDVILDENIRKNKKLGYTCLEYLVRTENPTKYIPWRVFQILSEDNNQFQFKKIYKLIAERKFPVKEYWIVNYFTILPEKEILKSHSILFLSAFKSTGYNLYSNFTVWDKFLKVEPIIYPKLLKQIYITNKDLKGHISLPTDIFIQRIDLLAADLPITKLCYFQQQHLADYFDHDFKDFLEILKKDNNFIVDYLQHWSSGILRSIDHDGLAIIWELDNAEKLLFKAFNFLHSINQFYSTDNFFQVFFKTANQSIGDRGLEFLKQYLIKYKTTSRKVNSVFNCIRNFYPDKFEELLLYFLRINMDPSVFSKIQWTNSSYIGTSRNSIGDRQSSAYQNVLNILDKIPKQKL